VATLKPFSFNFHFQGGWNDVTRETTILMQRFKLVQERITYYQTVGVK
jgi:hypothetical protein